MRNIKITIEYDGTNYNGWQTQKVKRHPPSLPPNADPPVAEKFRRMSAEVLNEGGQNSRFKTRTIQETIEKALKRILREEVKLVGSGRTDAGVHALGQVANFKTNSQKSLKLIKKGVNAVLPNDIAIKDIRGVNLDFHSRFNAKSKVYRYTLLNRSYRSVFEKKYSYLVFSKLDVNLIKKEVRCLIGRHNFKAFQAADKKMRPSVRKIKGIKISKKKGFIFIDFEADGFLYMMVRNIVGTLIEIGRGRFKKGSLKRILNSKNRKLAGQTAPARGLCLLKVNY